MNNKNKILVGCLALLLALSVGYALFSETITINGTATAKGNFDIVASCQTGIDSRIGTTTSLRWQKEGGYQNDSCTVSGNVVSMNAEFLYPGARRYFTVSLKNNGTISAILYLSKEENTEQICVSDDANGTNKRCASGAYLEGFYGNYITTFAAYRNSGVEISGVIFEDPSGNIITLQQAIENGIYDTSSDKLKLDVDYTLYVTYMGTVSQDINNPNTSNKMYVDVSNTTVYTFEQATN